MLHPCCARQWIGLIDCCASPPVPLRLIVRLLTFSKVINPFLMSSQVTRVSVAPICCTCTFLRCVALLFSTTQDSTILPSIPHSPLMSHSSASTSNFQLIFDNALNAYKTLTKNDLLTHPLAGQLERCNSASGVLKVLQEQVQELNQSQRRNETWTRWLDPTVKVLHAFSETLGKGVTLVCRTLSTCLRFMLSYLFHRHFQQQSPSSLQSASSF